MPVFRTLRNIMRLLRARGRPAPGVDAQEARRLQRQGAVIVDVRQEGEWRRGRIPGAVHVPLAKLEDQLADVPRDRPVVVHCALGGRSALAARRLAELGHQDVHNLEGGIKAWTRAGLPTEKDERATPPERAPEEDEAGGAP